MKTRKKWIVFTAFAMAFVLSFTGCGNTIPAMNEKESEEMAEEIAKMGEDAASLDDDESIADTDEPAEQSEEADMTAEQTTEPDETIAPVETEEPAQPTTAPKQTPEPSAPAQTEKPAATPAPTATPTPEPVHQHSWKEHVATTQVWVPNIVVVDDYEEQTTKYCLYICNCDYETTDAYDMVAHSKANLTPEHNYYTVQEHYCTEQVKVGSHEEDHGYYETSSYVDYYYCDCGETKN